MKIHEMEDPKLNKKKFLDFSLGNQSRRRRYEKNELEIITGEVAKIKKMRTIVRDFEYEEPGFSTFRKS